MADLQDIKREIKSVSNTQKTTRAMKLVSTAKLHKAKELTERSKMFADKLNSIMSEIAGRLKCHSVNEIPNRSFHLIDDPKVVDIVFVTADKGLCGGFNLHTIKAIKRLLAEFENKNTTVRLRGVGKKGIEFFKYNKIEMLDEVINLSSKPDLQRSDEFISVSLNDFIAEKTDALYIIYNGYKNMLTQELHVNKILPIDPGLFHCEDPIHEPYLEVEAYDQEVMLDSLTKKYVHTSMYFALIDSVAAEHSARMQAMDTATNNANEMVKSLNVKYNKARQAAITTELIEIISGVEAMR